MKAYSYLRWSSDKQTKGDSLRRQTEAIRSICESNGWTLDTTLSVDRAVSAYRGDNIKSGPLAEFAKSVESGRIETPCVLVVEAMDRLSRANIVEARNMLEHLIEIGVTVCTAHNRKIYDKSYMTSPFDMMMSLMEMNIAHEYSKNLGRRSSAAWSNKKNKARDGIVLSRKIPGWIRLPEGKKSIKDFRLIPERAKVVKRIFKDYLDGKGSRIIALNLTKDGVKPFGTAEQWNVTSVFRVLKSRAVIGEYQPQSYARDGTRIDEGPVIEGYYPAAIDTNTFYLAQETIKKKLIPRGKKNRVMNLFTGIVFCKKCGGNMILKTGAMTAKRNLPYIALVCSKGWRGGDCEYRSIRYEMIESSVLTCFSKRIITDIGEMSEVKESRLKSKRTELAETKEKIAKINDDLITLEVGDMPKSLARTLMFLEEKEQKLEDEIQSIKAIPSNLKDGIIEWRPMVENCENRVKMQMFLRSFIDKIVLNPVQQSGELYLKGMDQATCLNFIWDKKNKTSFILNGEQVSYDSKNIIWKSDPSEKKQIPATLAKLSLEDLKTLQKKVNDNPIFKNPAFYSVIEYNGETIECYTLKNEEQIILIEAKPTKGMKPRIFSQGDVFKGDIDDKTGKISNLKRISRFNIIDPRGENQTPITVKIRQTSK